MLDYPADTGIELVEMSDLVSRRVRRKHDQPRRAERFRERSTVLVAHDDEREPDGRLL